MSVVVLHDGQVTIVNSFPNDRTVLLHEEFDEPWRCDVEHEHGVFCSVDRGLVGRRRLERVVLRDPHGREDIYYREILDVDGMHVAQLDRRWQEAVAAWEKAGERMTQLEQALLRRRR